MVVKLSHETVVSLMRWLFREATTSFSLLTLSLLHVIKNLMWHCMGRPMRLLTCNNILALIDYANKQTKSPLDSTPKKANDSFHKTLQKEPPRYHSHHHFLIHATQTRVCHYICLNAHITRSNPLYIYQNMEQWSVFIFC
jgi:hypothetical protein